MTVYSEGVLSVAVPGGSGFYMDFDDAGLLPNALGVKFGDLLLYHNTGSFAALDGTSVRDFLGTAEIALGAGSRRTPPSSPVLAGQPER